ncbi:hypothetical protein G7054_g13058 [Neopestalotiopsis clavispora]|nr:hypothetical protein G7054_g13058 [Neopestalotiopsis clavispora]
MASRLFSKIATRPFLLGGTTIAGAGALLGDYYANDRNKQITANEADIQFNTSSGFVNSAGVQVIKPLEKWTGRVFEIRNDYSKLNEAVATGLPPAPGPERPVPNIDPLNDAPWLEIDFRKHPKDYCKAILGYCYDGNVENEFVLQKNTIRQWYHAPWMHWSPHGREPLNGLTYERATPSGELAKTQTEPLQAWACGFYNWAGATAFGKIWEDPANPQWNDFKFPKGTAVFKILMTNACDQALPTMVKSPSLDAVIKQAATEESPRNNYPSKVRLIQVDFAVVDDRAPTGWVFGTFMYDGRAARCNDEETDSWSQGWQRLFPVGLTWGNDHKLTQERVDQGDKPHECWISHEAKELLKHLDGTRKTWGWNGRMNGPVDNFKSACASCHSTSQKKNPSPMTFGKNDTDKEKMHWFRNIRSGHLFNDKKSDVSGDYSLQLMVGYANYLAWTQTQMPLRKKMTHQVALQFPNSAASKELAIIERQRRPLRQGQD